MDLETLRSTERRWEDLRTWRLWLGISLGPMLLFALFTSITLADAQSTAGNYLWLLYFAIPSLGWPLVSGWTYLLAVVHSRGVITRRGCLLLGVTTFAVLPPTVLFFATILGSRSVLADFVEELNQRPAAALSTLAWVETACVLFGLLNGWVFWRIGVRPAVTNATHSPAHVTSTPTRRTFAALLLASVPTTIPMIPSALAGPRGLIAVSLACPGIWLIAGAISVKVRMSFRLHECLLLGMLLALLVTPAVLLLGGLIAQLSNPIPFSVIAPLQKIGLSAITAAGVVQVPFGVAGGWLFWRMAALPTGARMDSAIERRWHDVRKGRLIAALIVAPALALGLCVAITTLIMGAPSDPSLTSAKVASAVLTFVAWCLAVSLLYLFLICRRRGVVRRRDCLLPQTLAFCLFAALGAALSQLGLGADGNAAMDMPAGLGGLFFYSVGAVFLFMPLGLLSGWLVWRSAIRPVPAPLQDAAVFD
jgi:hypothetical protein